MEIDYKQGCGDIQSVPVTVGYGNLIKPETFVAKGEQTVKKDDFYLYALDAFRPAESMIKMVPSDKMDWKPAQNFMTMGELLCHLGDGIGTMLACLVNNDWPQPEDQGGMPSCNAEEALARLEKDKSRLRDVLSSMTDEEFAEKIATTPWGANGKLEKMALDFREHFTNHKMQLFTYLKLLGLPVNTQTLYMG
jgi:hypothetical protein